MGTIARIMEQPAERIAVHSGGSAISYARLNADIDAATVKFRGEGIGAGRRSAFADMPTTPFLRQLGRPSGNHEDQRVCFDERCAVDRRHCRRDASTSSSAISDP
jgi:hypothetical protein